MTEQREGGAIGLALIEKMGEITRDRHGQLAIANAERNAALKDRGASIAALRDAPLGEGDSAIVIAAGPSIRRFDPIRKIKESGYKGCIIATDSAIAYCLRNGVVPHLAVTLDPHAKRIVRWFGDPDLTRAQLEEDDYYRRQDMDTVFADEMRANQEIMGLLDEHGSKIAIALSTSASEAVVRRVTQTGMKVHWWNPMLDDPDEKDSATRKIWRLNPVPCVNAGGNVGSACWMMAHAVLGKKQVALTGVDFGYYGDTPHRATQYYHEAVALVGEDRLDELFVRIFNPFTQSWFYTDPAYLWYREAFLEMAADADCKTYNCTEGGILFGDNVTFEPLADFLSRHA